MIIESIRLKNIKSYDGEGCPIDFRHGVNLIWGENGSGKTTILEAIGFCLFDALDYNLGQFIREGESEGEVVLTFKHHDERSYAIVREIRNSGGLKIRDVASGRDLITKRKDAEDWLNEQLGIEFGKYGRDLFQNAIGVAQGMITGAFAVSPAARKKIFDPILRVDEYDQAYKKLVDSKNYLDNMLHQAQREQSHLTGCLEQLPPTKKRYQDLFEQIRVGERDLEMAQEQIDTQKEETAELDDTLRKLDELDEKISTANNTMTSLAGQIETAEALFEEARLASEVITTTRSGHEMYDHTKKELADLESRQVVRNRLLEELQSVELAISRLDQQISGLKRDLHEVDAAEKKIGELEPDVDRQTECEIRRSTALEQWKERDRILRDIKDLKSRVQEKKNSLEAMELQLIQRTELEMELHEKSIERDGVLSDLREIDVRLSQAQMEREALVQQLQEVLLVKQSWETACEQRDDLTSEIEKDKQNLKHVEEQVQERDRLEQVQGNKEREKEDCIARQMEIQQESALCNHNLNELRNHLSLLQTAESAECPVCRRSLSDLERDNVETDFIKDEQDWLQRLKVAQTNDSNIKSELQQIDRRLHEIHSWMKNLPIETQATELRAWISEKNNRLENLIDQINTSAGVNRVVKDLQSRNDELVASKNDLTDKKGTLDDQRNLLDQAIVIINQKIALLPTDAVKKATEEEIDDLDIKIRTGILAAEKLSGAEKELENAKIELEMLGDPRTELNRLSGIASRRSALVEEYGSSEGEKELQSGNRMKLSEQLLEYATLDQEIGHKKSVLLETEQDYRNFERNVLVSQTLEARQVMVNKLRQHHFDQVAILNGLQIEKGRVGAGYDPIYHREMRQDLERLSISATTLCVQLGEWRKQFEATGKELSDLEQLQEQLEKKEEEVGRLEDLKGTFEFVRNSIKRASPEIVNKRVGAISFTADRIFQDILGDLLLSLTWDQAYAIKINSGQKERVFEQLSGGEQMAASIAVRLALLLHMSDRNIRWLFLDEPTANMDDKRRDRLAERITQINQLDQVFVITHDDAFDRDTHHLIEVSKVDGKSYARNVR